MEGVALSDVQNMYKQAMGLGGTPPPVEQVNTGAAQTNTTQEQTPIPQPVAEVPKPTEQTAPQAAPVQQEPTPSVSPNDWLKSYVEATGHTAQSPEEIKEALAFKDKYQDLNTRYSDLEAKSKVSPYANELVKTLNEMYANGAKESEVKTFIELQNVDTAIESPTDYISKGESLIKMQMRSEKPFLTNNQINALYNKQFGDLDQDDELSMAEFQSAAHNAKTYVDAKKVSAAQPESILQFRQTAEQKQQFEQNIKAYVGTVKGIEHPFEFKVGDGVEKFTFKATGEQESYVQQVMGNILVNRGIAPTQENLPKINAAYTEAFWQVCGQSAVDSAYRHAKADATKQVYAAVNGVPTTTPIPNATPPQAPSALSAVQEAWRKANGFK